MKRTTPVLNGAVIALPYFSKEIKNNVGQAVFEGHKSG